MKIGRTEVLKKDYRKLPKQVQKSADKQIVQLLLDHSHPSLHLEGISGHRGLFSVRINQRYRMSLSFEKGDTIMLRRVLDHDDLYKNP
ncbi:MAG: ParE family toxin-like protein [Candidatus Anammoxibacter sp.]